MGVRSSSFGFSCCESDEACEEERPRKPFSIKTITDRITTSTTVEEDGSIIRLHYKSGANFSGSLLSLSTCFLRGLTIMFIKSAGACGQRYGFQATSVWEIGPTEYIFSKNVTVQTSPVTVTPLRQRETLTAKGKCHCKQIFAYNDAFW